MTTLRETNDPKLQSWVPVRPGSDFPIQNIPFGIYENMKGQVRACTAIGEYVIDIAELYDHGGFSDIVPRDVFLQPVLNDFLALGKKKIREVRAQLSRILRRENDKLANDMATRELVLVPVDRARMLMPLRVGNYTDFYSSEEHAFNVGSMFRDPKNALLPNWKHLPVGYHGRASSIVVSGTDIHRPQGQIKSGDTPTPQFSATQKLDFELELAFVTCGENQLGHPVPIDKAEDFIAGFVLFNDWSARDIQQWEYVPLGPFLGKNFASTISPWIVTMDALEPFRVNGPPQQPAVLPYLSTEGERNFDILLEVRLQPDGGEEVVLSRSNAKYLYWRISQQLAHHTVNGCNVKVGDLYASGTISGPSPGSFGSMLELSWNGAKPLKMPDGSTRTFLEDGDTIVICGHAEKDGVRIGFGSCMGKVVSPPPDPLIK